MRYGVAIALFAAFFTLLAGVVTMRVFWLQPLLASSGYGTRDLIEPAELILAAALRNGPTSGVGTCSFEVRVCSCEL